MAETSVVVLLPELAAPIGRLAPAYGLSAGSAQSGL